MVGGRGGNWRLLMVLGRGLGTVRPCNLGISESCAIGF